MAKPPICFYLKFQTDQLKTANKSDNPKMVFLRVQGVFLIRFGATNTNLSPELKNYNRQPLDRQTETGTQSRETRVKSNYFVTSCTGQQTIGIGKTVQVSKQYRFVEKYRFHFQLFNYLEDLSNFFKKLKFQFCWISARNGLFI